VNWQKKINSTGSIKVRNIRHIDGLKAKGDKPHFLNFTAEGKNDVVYYM